MKVEILDNPKKKKIISKLNNDYGISKLPYLFIKTGKDKYRIYSGGFSREELNWIAKNIHIELVGLKFCTMDNEDIRINFDVANIPEIKNEINKNILEINQEIFDSWVKGEDILTEEEFSSKYVFIKHEKDIYGSGRTSNEKLKNFVPKDKRVRKN